ncbi:YitT family protein [Candidatus Allofournierella merdavium]|uniref:YitT family protein n=1 Tax=Candidatus Allofournierella merdavium TaxID=2838593 RepID=UPI00374E7D93
MGRVNWKELATDLAFDLAGSLLYGAGVYTFALKGGFATGGVSGLALIFNYLWGLPVGAMSLGLNLPLVLLTWRTLGRGFFLKSLRTMVISNLVIDLLFPLFPVYEGSRLLAAGFSGVLMGAGLSLIYMRGSSTGGSDFVIHAAKRKAPHISFGSLSLAIDASIILLGIPAFGDIDAALYGMVSAFALTIVMDKIIYGAGSGKLVLVITTEGQAVSRAIDKAVERGSTLVDVTGSYSGLPRRMVMCACSNNEVFKVRQAAYRVDPGALVMICEASEVFGEGFRAPEGGEKAG